MRTRLDPRRSFRPLLEALETRTLLSVCTVDRLTDLGQGTGMMGDLRYCITQAQDGDSIQFAVTGTIRLNRALPDLTRSISIEGPGANRLTVSGISGCRFRVFTVSSSTTTVISGLSITGGCDEFGGGIRNRGTLTLSSSAVSGNLANGLNNSAGGGIYNDGTLFVSNTTVSQNLVWGERIGMGGGIYNAGTLTVSISTISQNETGTPDSYAGGVCNNGTLIINNSIIFQNSANGRDAQGGGILNSRNAILTVSNSTITHNSATGQRSSYGGGIDNLPNATLTVMNSTITDNRAVDSEDPGIGGGILQAGILNMQNTILARN